MDELEVRPWRRHGQDRLYVNRVGTRESVAWYDCGTARITVIDEAYRDRALAALTPFVVRSVTLDPERQHDLTGNKPGSALDRKVGELAPGGWKGLLARLLRRSPSSSWSVGREGERITGASLNRLRSLGWCVLHSIPLASGSASTMW